ncbi:MAG TPA: sorbosone dehydrogenase family protein [Stellaceae bacterium]|nr:sorbosone dehydrogenase family protein [Stellaceae bacterium]
MRRLSRIALTLAFTALAGGVVSSRAEETAMLTGTAAFGDYTKNSPGVERLIRPSDLPAPYASESARNASKLVPRPAGAELGLPPGFSVTAYVKDLATPRQMKIAPNGDLFVSESDGKRIRVIRPGRTPGSPPSDTVVFAKGLEYRPYGLAFYPPGPNPHYLYVATEGQVLRYPYHVGDLVAAGKPEVIVPDVPVGHHWTRDVLFTPDGKRMLVAVGSGDNDGEQGMQIEVRRADVLDYDPDGHDMKIYAYGIRNPVTLAFYPGTDTLWTTTNERDTLGDNLPPDYVTRVKEGGFYGWPWYYIGGNPDPTHKGEHPELQSKALVPDVLFQAHSAPLGIAFYTGTQFPAEYRDQAFVALHGSWNRAQRTGYKIVRIVTKDGVPTGAYEDFMTGFVAPGGEVWGRPVGIVVAADGSLLVSDDGSNTIWRIAYTGEKRAQQ